MGPVVADGRGGKNRPAVGNRPDDGGDFQNRFAPKEFEVVRDGGGREKVSQGGRAIAARRPLALDQIGGAFGGGGWFLPVAINRRRQENRTVRAPEGSLGIRAPGRGRNGRKRPFFFFFFFFPLRGGGDGRRRPRPATGPGFRRRRVLTGGDDFAAVTAEPEDRRRSRAALKVPPANLPGHLGAKR